MKKLMFFLALWVLVAGSSCDAGTLLIGKKAKALVGKPKDHLSASSYTVLVLERNDRNPPHLDPIDAIIFNPGKGTFEKKRTRDRNHRVILDSPTGRPGEKVTPSSLQKYLSLIEANHMIPFVFQGKKGEELALIYTDPYNTSFVYEMPDGIRVDVTGPFGNRHRGFDEMPIHIRKLP